MKKAKLKTTKWDVVDYLKTDKDMADYLEAAMEDGNPVVIATAIGNIARAKGMTQVARKAGIGRVSLYKALSPEGNPEFSTILKVVNALGLRLHAKTS
jgi:probable addiction module antidote protein